MIMCFGKLILVVGDSGIGGGNKNEGHRSFVPDEIQNTVDNVLLHGLTTREVGSCTRFQYYLHIHYNYSSSTSD